MQEESRVSPAEVSELIRIARQHGLTELMVQQGASRVEIRLTVDPILFTAGLQAPLPLPETSPERSSDGVEILSPMTGIFYMAPGPNEPPFVQPGDLVREGDTIGIIEAMKVFSEVLADRSGRVRRIVPVSGQLVQQGEVILELTPELIHLDSAEPSAEPSEA